MRWLKRISYLRVLSSFVSILLVLTWSQPVVYAGSLTPEQTSLFDAGIKYYNAEDQGNCSSPSTLADAISNYQIPEAWGVRGRLAQLLMVSVTNEADVQPLIDAHVGGVFLQGRQFTNADAVWLNKFNTSTQVPPIIAADEEGGQVQRIRNINGPNSGAMPSAKVMGTWDDAAITAQAKKQAFLLRTMGVKMAFAPVADLDTGSPVISGQDRAFSANPDVVADKAGTFAAGYRDTGVLPVFKHFPGHGHANGDSHTQVVSTPSLDKLKASDLKPYESLLQSGDSGVMMGHLNVPGLTENGIPTSLSPEAYNLLRNDYNFDGLAITDDIGSMVAIKSKYGVDQAAVMAIEAGADMALFINEGTVNTVLDKLEAEYKAGRINDARINQSLARIGRVRAAFGLTKKTITTSSGITAPIGKDNREATYNFFISKGLSPVIAAGFVGNLMQESGINPKSVNKIGATGIAQWLSGRKANLLKKPNYQDLSVQLEFIWEELNGGESIAYKKILAATDLQSVTYVIRKFYERPGEAEANDSRRLSEATKALQEFGGGTGVLPSPTSTGYCDQASTDIGKETQFIDGFTIYSQGDPAWASHPYGSSTIKASGCGPTSLAMVVTNLTGQRVTPDVVADYGTRNGMFVAGAGSSWSLFTKGPTYWGLKSQQIQPSQIASTLQNGGLVIASGTGPVPFSSGGHIIVIRAVDSNGDLLIGNPGFKASNNQSWPLSQIQPSIKALWAITK